MATEAKSEAVEKLTEVFVMIADMQFNLAFIILENISFDAVIVRPAIKRLGQVFDFLAQILCSHFTI